MKIKTAFRTIFLLTIFTFSFGIVNAQEEPGEPFEGSTNPITVNGKVDRDMYSHLSISPSFVEIKQPATVSLTLLNPDGTYKSNRTVEIYVEEETTGITISQPNPTNSNGETTGLISSSIPGTYNVCAKDITDGFDILILDCETVYVTPVPVPTVLPEPPYTKGTSNSILWNISGSLTYQYLAQTSKTSNFNTIALQSGWLENTGYNFQNLENGQIYFYRVKARNIYGGESSWSSSVFTVQDNSGPAITILDISSIGENNTSVWDPEYTVSIRYRIKDNVGVSNKNFWCLLSDSSKEECKYTHITNGDIWEVSIQLKDLQIVEENKLLNQYLFCVEAVDLVGNVTRNCEAKIDITTPSGEEKPKPPITPPVKPKPTIMETVTEIIDNTIGKIEPEIAQDSAITFTATNIAVGLSVLLGGLTSLPYFLLQTILALLSLLGFRKKGNISGYVYDSVTKEPISQAIVRVFNESNELVWTDVTNGNGYFSSIDMQDGEYSMKITARNYTFPSKIVFGKTDFPLEKIYHGETFLSKGNKIPDYSIPLDKEKMPKAEELFQRFIFRTKYIWKSLHILIFFLGLIFSLYSLSISQVWWNYLILSLYVPALIALIISFFGDKQKYGKVRDEKGKPLQDIIVGLKENEFDKLVSKRVTNSKGEYRFVVNSGTYSVVILNSEYRVIDEKNLLDIVAKKNGVNIVCPNIVVKKLEDTTKEEVVEPLEEL